MENQIEIYTGSDNQTQIEVQFENDTLWLNQKQIAEVFGTEVPAINKHIKNIIKESELQLDGNYFHFGNSSNRRHQKNLKAI